MVWRPYCRTNATSHTLVNCDQTARDTCLPVQCRRVTSVRHRAVIPVAMQMSLPLVCLPLFGRDFVAFGGNSCDLGSVFESLAICDVDLSGIVSCDAAAIRIRIRIVRCQLPAKRQKHKHCETQTHFLPPLLLVGSKELVLKVPKRGQLSHCDSCDKKTLRFVCPSCTRDTDGIAAKLLRCGIASEAQRRNMPLRLGFYFPPVLVVISGNSPVCSRQIIYHQYRFLPVLRLTTPAPVVQKHASDPRPPHTRQKYEQTSGQNMTPNALKQGKFRNLGAIFLFFLVSYQVPGFVLLTQKLGRAIHGPIPVSGETFDELQLRVR